MVPSIATHPGIPREMTRPGGMLILPSPGPSYPHRHHVTCRFLQGEGCQTHPHSLQLKGKTCPGANYNTQLEAIYTTTDYQVLTPVAPTYLVPGTLLSILTKT